MSISTPYVYIPGHTGDNVYQLNTSDGSYVTSRTTTSAIGAAIDLNGFAWFIGLNGYLYKATLDLGNLWTYNNSSPNAYSCCLDKDGKIWAAHGGGGTGNTVIKYDTDGSVLATYTCQTFTYGICADCNGYVWVTNSNSDSVSRITVATGTLDNFALTYGDSPKQLCADLDGNILVCCYGNSVIRKINGASGAVIATYTSVSGGGCYSIALDSNNNIFVTNFTHNSVSKLNSSGTPVAIYGSLGSPVGIAVDGDDNVWVTAYAGSAVRKYDNNLSGITGTYTTGASPTYLDTGYAYQHFVLKSDVIPSASFIPRLMYA